MTHPAHQRLFVYGSLLSGLTHHRLLARERRISEAQTAASLTLLDLGAWPGVTRAPLGPVRGEVYDVGPATLARLDEFEQAPRLFVRDRVALDDGDDAWIYLFEGPKAATYADRGVVVSHGDWRRWLTTR